MDNTMQHKQNNAKKTNIRMVENGDIRKKNMSVNIETKEKEKLYEKGNECIRKIRMHIKSVGMKRYRRRRK